MTRHDLVKGGEILVEEADERDGLHTFGQEGKSLEIGKQDRGRWHISRLHLAILLKLLGNRHRQDVDEQLFGTCFLGGDILRA